MQEETGLMWFTSLSRPAGADWPLGAVADHADAHAAGTAGAHQAHRHERRHRGRRAGGYGGLPFVLHRAAGAARPGLAAHRPAPVGLRAGWAEATGEPRLPWDSMGWLVVRRSRARYQARAAASAECR